MTKLIEFTAEEMKGCPVFEAEHQYGEMFIWVDSDGDVVSEDFDESSYYRKKFKCNPMDRCKAICKHLFELMPQLHIIDIEDGEVCARFKVESEEHQRVVDLLDGEWWETLSINPFLHTGITQITREEVMR